MSQFESNEPPYRLARTNYGDDLQAICRRELGDANRWVELVWLNDLVPPYITDEDNLVTDGVMRSGSLIKVPSVSGSALASDTGHVYERDIAMEERRMTTTATGDLQIVTGADNLRQQLKHRIVTPMGQARRHAEYGCKAWRLVGKVNGPAASQLAAQYVWAALLSDYRVKTVKKSNSSVIGDAIRVTAECEAIAGNSVDIVVEG